MQVDQLEPTGPASAASCPPRSQRWFCRPAKTILQSHRREVTVVFCDLRGFTSFTETPEPEEVMTVLEEYHRCLGDLIIRHGGTLERFVGDGLLVLFNDPVPCADHPGHAVRMALEMRQCMQEIGESWHRRGHDLGFGVGIAQGYATLGRIGFDERTDYAVIGSVPNLASRLCDEAKAGQILIDRKAMNSVEKEVEARSIGELPLKGFHRPVACFEVLGPRAG